ncbi:HNH endonuclease [Marinospirillum celere]|uniref:HNH endonuclease n=1 Tax=Marinospirillum celere TaxID=1122252 RepID=A0A1I1EMG5_9GAMM|nr:HNH endonuclease signature motif containing protein [Marinospirillum celere]SFB88291.1 HNH endonuclease [Marinospirillum celere]
MFSEADEKLIAFFIGQPDKEATATQVQAALGYTNIGAVNLHVVRIANNLAAFVRYTPEERENGQACGTPAPFNRKSDGTPYLEVHHKTPLALGGEDTVENAIALCPNCHRKAHYG